MNGRKEPTLEDKQFHQQFDKLFSPTTLKKSDAPDAGEPRDRTPIEAQELALDRIATELRGLQRSLAKSAAMGRKSDALYKRGRLPGKSASELLGEHVEMIGQALDGIAAIKRYRPQFELAKLDSERMREINTRHIS